ncbi:FecCD family ABC transporter permease [Thermococcus sp.]
MEHYKSTLWDMHFIFGKLLLFVFTLLSLVLGVFVGSYPTNPLSLDDLGRAIIVNIRLPRTLLAASAGAGLSLAGMTFQAVFRNPLVEGSLLGVSAGVAVGAALGFAFLPDAGITPLAMLFGMIAVAMAYFIAKIGGKISPISLILGGVIVSALFSAFLSILLYSCLMKDFRVS